MKKSNLDEMQEQALLHIEHNGCHLAFWALLAAMTAESLLGFEPKAMAGEWIVFMVLAAYLMADCLRHGIWDRRLKANGKTNLVASLIAGAAVGIYNMLMVHRIATEPLDYVIAGGISGVCTFLLCLAALSISTALYKKRRKKLEQE